MSVKRNGGPTPFEYLRGHYDDTDLTCPACGYEDDGGRWRAGTSGATVLYRHDCPKCGAASTREIHLRDSEGPPVGFQ
jgi:predicted RNA-binding Zn-ribbon protein involved in translation (DUF1610 family)